MDTTPDKISVVIAGGGDIAAENFEALISDWLRLGTDSEVDAKIYLPASRDTFSPVVQAARAWCVVTGQPYGVVTTEDGVKSTDLLVKYADPADVILSEGESAMALDLISVLAEDAESGREPVVILAWGPAEEPPDLFTGLLFAAADDADITVLEFAASGGLEKISSTPDELEAVDEEPGTVEPMPDPMPSPDEAQAIVTDLVDEIEAEVIDLIQAATDSAEFPPYWDLHETLSRASMFLMGQQISAQAATTAKVPDTDLYHAIVYHLERLEGSTTPPEPETPSAALAVPILETSVVTVVSEPVSEPAQEPLPEMPVPVATRKGRARAGDGELSVYVPADGDYRKAKKAAGRMPGGWNRRIVAVEDVPHLMAA